MPQHISIQLSHPLTSSAIRFLFKKEAKYLGYIWRRNLSAASMINERIHKARQAFFQFGSISAFQGNLSPISSSSIIECCVYPVLLNGVENWILCKESLSKLEKFQGEMAKRILKLLKWQSNTAAKICLGWLSIHAICTIPKLKYLSRVISCDDQDNVSRRALSSLADNVEALSIVSECRELKERYCTDNTSSLLVAKCEDGTSILKQMKECIKRKDATLLLESAQVYPDLCLISTSVGWRRLWDFALDHGSSAVNSLKHLVRVIIHPTHAPSVCPKCDVMELPTLLPDHIFSQHTRSKTTWDTLLQSLIAMDDEAFTHLKCVLHLF